MSILSRRGNIFQTSTKASLVAFFFGVATLFAGVGVLSDSLAIEGGLAPALLWSIAITAVSAVLWAFFGVMQMRKAMIAMAVVQTGIYFASSKWFPRGPYAPDRAQMMQELALRDVAVMALVFIGYSLFVLFIRREGKRFFAVHTEMELAAGIQKDLVPTVHQQLENFEVYGVSVPSGRVGGDLVDVTVADDRFCAYMADVAGHGVAAGVLMSMVKTAVRTRVISSGAADDKLLPVLNTVLGPMTGPGAYVTFAYVSGAATGCLQFSVAAHIPLFHYRSALRRVDRVSVENFPVGMFENAEYATGVFDCEPGDIVGMVTDGLTEIFDATGQELGPAYIANAIANSPLESLSSISATILQRSEQFGPITDDRSLLLLRCTA